MSTKSKKRFSPDRWWQRFYKKLSMMDEIEVRSLARVIEHELAIRTTLAESVTKAQEKLNAEQ